MGQHDGRGAEIRVVIHQLCRFAGHIHETDRETMRQMARWHIWFGWLVGVPLLLWTASGLFMAARPLAEVRGEALRNAPAALTTAGLVVPRTAASKM